MLPSFSFFISHCSEHKELARFIYYNALNNNLFPWYDEALLSVGIPLKDKIEEGIQSSQGFLLLHSAIVAKKEWVKLEMALAKAKHEANKDFKLMVIKLDNTPLDPLWKNFLYLDWDHDNKASSVIKMMESLTEKKGLIDLTNAALLNNIPEDYTKNLSGTVAEHTRNLMAYNLSRIKNLLLAISKHGYDHEMKDSIAKLLKVHLLESIPALSGGVTLIGSGELEFIHSNRMRCAPKVNFLGVPNEYIAKTVHNDEIVTRIRITRADNGEPVNHAIPIVVSLDSEL